MNTTWGTILAATMLLTGCADIDGPEGPDDPEASCDTPSWSGDAEIEVGTGESCFSQVASDDVVPLIGGPQGGFHIWLGLRCRDCDATTHVTYGVQDPASGTFVWGHSQSGMLELEAAEDYRQTAGITAMVPGAPWDEFEGDAADFVGQELSLYAEVLMDGTLHTSEARFTVGDIEWQKSSCPDCN